LDSLAPPRGPISGRGRSSISCQPSPKAPEDWRSPRRWRDYEHVPPEAREVLDCASPLALSVEQQAEMRPTGGEAPVRCGPVAFEHVGQNRFPPVSGLNRSPSGLAVSGGDLFVGNGYSGTIGEYTTGGATVNASLVSGLSGPEGLEVSGGDIFVVNNSTGTIGKYTTGGATVNASLVSGLDLPECLDVETVPEPSSFGLLAIGLALLPLLRRHSPCPPGRLQGRVRPRKIVRHWACTSSASPSECAHVDKIRVYGNF